jgi:hypothetical protein
VRLREFGGWLEPHELLGAVRAGQDAHHTQLEPLVEHQINLRAAGIARRRIHAYRIGTDRRVEWRPAGEAVVARAVASYARSVSGDIIVGIVILVVLVAIVWLDEETRGPRSF